MDTIQNAKNTMKFLYDNNIITIIVITSEYHIRRGNILFKGVSMLMAETLKKSSIELPKSSNCSLISRSIKLRERHNSYIKNFNYLK